MDKGVLQALPPCLWVYGEYSFRTKLECLADEGNSRVDYVLQVNGEDKVLVEAKSPSVMRSVRDLLPPRGIELTWARRQTLVQKILAKVSTPFSSPTTLALKKYMQAALHLGLRQMEWLFLTCHNYWIVCRLVRDDEHPFLAYSPVIDINDSSVFRALLGAILSVVENVSIRPSEFNPHMAFDTIVEEDNVPEYLPSSEEEITNNPPNITAEYGLMVCPCLLSPVILFIDC